MTPRILSFLIAVGLAQAALAQNATLITTFTNPTPAASDFFGVSLVALGDNRVVIGANQDDTTASNSGSAYLFNTNGTLITTIANPTPAANDNFSLSVATDGVSLVLIGAPGDDIGAVDSGAAYLFDSVGNFIRTFDNPTPAVGDLFGFSVAMLGRDKVVIGARRDDLEGLKPGAGAVYLFNTNGTYLLTITKPTILSPTGGPKAGDNFGYSLSTYKGVESWMDRIVVGAAFDDAPVIDSGGAYLFDGAGNWVQNFFNPSPTSNDYFGWSVAAIGADSFLVGAYGDDTTGSGVGRVYRLNRNAGLVASFDKPVPAGEEAFGYSVAALGSDLVVIGARGDNINIVSKAGRVYLFNTTGSLVATIDNPTPATFDYFGSSVGSIGNDKVLVGAYADDADATDAGAAYMFALLPPTPPTLAIAPATPGNATISWTPITPGFVLQETEALSPVNWTNSLSGAANPSVAPTTPPGKYFRLKKP